VCRFAIYQGVSGLPGLRFPYPVGGTNESSYIDVRWRHDDDWRVGADCREIGVSGSLEVGAQFGPYLLKRLVGSGGMGSVFEAEDTVLQRSVALKLISSTYAQDPEYRERLQREARIAGRLQDPHVVPIHSAGEIDGHLYVDMRLINGIDLDTTLRRTGRLSPARAVAVVSQIASALDDAHSAGVLHRDVKPGNILLTSNDFAYLVDFGIANAAAESKLTQLGDVLGTWTYMSPERFSGNNTQVTASADIYALACVLYEALTGTPPFTGDRVSVIGAHLTQPPPRPSLNGRLPGALDDVIARGMAKQPEHRYATAGDLARAAEAAIGTGAISVPTSPITLPTTPAPTGPNTNPTQAAATWGGPGGQTQVGGPSSGPQSPTAWGPGGPTQVGGPPPGPFPDPSASSFAAPANAPAGKSRTRWLLIAAAVVLVVVLAAGIGIWKLTGGKSKDNPTPSAAPAVDVSKLDVGTYATQPRSLPGPATEADGRFLAAFSLAEGQVDPYVVDPKLSYLYGTAVPDRKLAATAISGNSTPIVQPVLEQYGMVSAYIVQGVPQRLQDFVRSPSGGALIDMVSGFPNPDSATKAATAMDAADFAVNPANQHASIPGYPQAVAHYQPNNRSMAATMASGSLVVSILSSDTTADSVDALTQRVKAILDLQVPLMQNVIPPNDAALTSLPLDPDDMLRRAFVARDQPTISDSYGTIGPKAAILCASSEAVKEGLYAQAGVDRCATTPSAQLLRAQDESAANTLLPKLVDATRQAGTIDHDVASPDGLSDAKCYETKNAIWADNASSRFFCWVSFGRYVAAVSSDEEKDARERAAAQYAILVHSA
jgi:serine/threonine kinase PknH